MLDSILSQAAALLRTYKEKHKRWMLLLCLSAFVALGTLGILMLNGVALTHKETVLDCAYQPHVHEDACYADVLDAEGNVVDRVLVCGLADYVVHTHNDDCYDRDSNLVCPLPELEAHQHTDECWAVERVLSCEQEEAPAHQHTEDCYTLTRGALTCDIPEHIHSDACYDSVLTCNLDHEHTEDCFEKVLSCGFEEHEHTDECYLMENILTCGLEETEGHTHSDACYAEVRTLVCDKPEVIPHVHNDSCYETILDEDGNVVAVNRICGLPQVEVHVHGPECFYEIELTAEEVEELTQEEAAPNEEEAPAEEESSSPERGGVIGEAGDGGVLPPAPETDEPNEEAPAEEEQESSSPERGGVIGEAEDRGVIPPALETDEPNEEAPAEGEPSSPERGGVAGEAGDGGVLPEAEDEELFLEEELLTEESADLLLEEVAQFITAEDEPEPETEAEPETETEAETETETSGEPEISEEPEAPALPAQRFTAETEDISVTVEAPEGAFPAGTVMLVAPAAEEPVADAAAEAVDGHVVAVQAVDITFTDAEGHELEPLLPIRVTLLPLTAPENTAKAAPVVVHMDDRGAAAVVALAEEPEQPAGADAVTGADSALGTAAEELTFESDAFSVYAVVYTVDFHWEVDGETYEYSIPGGSFVGLREIVEALGITEDAEAFVADISSAAFSDPALVSVSAVEEDATVGELKDALDLTCEYTAELTEKQIAEIDALTAEAGDWALISLKPFQSEESLTVAMQDGEVFTILVTDAQLSTNVLTADGKTYKITVTFDDDADIPIGTKLVAKEIEFGSDEYIQHLGQAWAEVNRDYLALEELRNQHLGGLDDYEVIHPVNLDEARFFEVSLIYNGEEIEPAAPVQVDIQYEEGLKLSEDAGEPIVGAAHFTGGGVEVIDQVETTEDPDGGIVEFRYEQDSFSDIGTYVGQETYDNAGSSGINPAAAFPRLRALAASAGGTQDTLDAPTASKSLTPNKDKDSGVEDGTYTLSLSVTGAEIVSEAGNNTKSNVLFVMDRSSSMTSNCVSYELYTGPYQSGITYYGSNDGENYFSLLYNNGNYYTESYFDYFSWSTIYTGLYSGNIYTGKTRLKAEQEAMSILFDALLSKNTAEIPDMIEISVISFADQRQNGKNSEVDWTTNKNTLMSGVNQPSTPSGTNWEDALIYAKEIADIKKNAQPDEPVYIIFLTDGEPTAVYGEYGGAIHYNDVRGGFEYALTEKPTQNYDGTGTTAEKDNKNSLDRAKELVDAKYKLYGIFTFNPGEAQTKYLRRLMNFAYGQGDKAYENDATKEDTDIVKQYFTNADSPEALTMAFDQIFSDISSSIGHGSVTIRDGMTTDAMTSTFVSGSPAGIKYTVSNGDDILYTVTASGSNSSPQVTFTIDGHDYTTNEIKTYQRTEEDEEKSYYSVTVGGVEYKMALASLDSEGELTWDLSGVGTLLGGCTYTADIIVWPDQDAYDYVAALNNKISPIVNSKGDTVEVKWDDSKATDTGKGYSKGGVEKYPSIVKYPDGTYAVLTNTHQEMTYFVVTTTTSNGDTQTSVDGPYEVALDTPAPMPLTATDSGVEKVWNIDRDTSILYNLLYGSENMDNKDFDPNELIRFNITEDEETKPYTSIPLPGNWTEGSGYDWGNIAEGDAVTYNGKTFSKRWSQGFSIPTGLMLSVARMDALGMDKSAYPSGLFPDDPDDPETAYTTYYILEDGHDYTIEEEGLTYEFDFSAPVYHPMLVDGRPMSVNYTFKIGEDGKKYAEITGMTQTGVGALPLRVENTLRGYITLNKVVVDKDGKTLPADSTRFKYTVTLQNEDALFFGDSIPWYGINGLYYHTEDAEAPSYYQVEYHDVDGGTGQKLVLATEASVVNGTWYDAVCVDENGDPIPFNTATIDPQTVRYTVPGDGETEDETITVTVSGNRMIPSSPKAGTPVDAVPDTIHYKTATADLMITQTEMLSIANIPVGTKYTITEADTRGYKLVRIDRQILDGRVKESGDTFDPPSSTTLTGTIVTNRDNHIIYTNRCDVVDLTLRKLDGSGRDLAGAVFQLRSVSGDGREETLVEGVGGLGSVTKKISGKETTYDSAFETDGSQAYTLAGLENGTYRLYEMVVPDGYINTLKYIEFTVQDRVITLVTQDAEHLTLLREGEDDPAEDGGEDDPAEEDPAGPALLRIVNEAGARLPSTGGAGLTAYYAAGAALTLLGAGGILLRRRRMRRG